MTTFYLVPEEEIAKMFINFKFKHLKEYKKKEKVILPLGKFEFFQSMLFHER